MAPEIDRQSQEEADGVTPAGFSRERIRGALRGGHLMKEAAR